MPVEDQSLEIFLQYRPKLFGIAYRMLGTVADSEDVTQEAYIRWHNAEKQDIKINEAWLVAVVTRLSIDRLRKVKAARETYIGPWLPEPLIVSQALSPEDESERNSDISLAFLYLLERLSPAERAVLILRDVFDTGYAEIAEVIGRSEVAVRQIISRARSRVKTGKTRFQMSESKRAEMVRSFVKAVKTGDNSKLTALFSNDISLVSDGGGIVNAARKPIYGSERISRLFIVSTRKIEATIENFLISINGETALMTVIDGKTESVMSFNIEDGNISGLFRVMNPQKLTELDEMYKKINASGLSQSDSFERLV